VSDLKRENSSLKSELNALKKEVEQLKIISDMDQATSSEKNLKEELS
jgi:cell division septum initiation protein DivIVA